MAKRFGHNLPTMTDTPDKAPAADEASLAKGAKFDLLYSRHFPQWLAEKQVSLAFTTYHTNRLCALGLSRKGQVSVCLQTFPRPMGLWASADARNLLLADMFRVLRFEGLVDADLQKRGIDRIYVPRFSYTTGDSDIHDIAADGDGRPIFVNCLFSCVATLSPRYSFAPLWKPDFISRLAPEDRCHLNGLAMVEGKPRYVTCVANSDVSDGWRDHRADGGKVIDITTNEVVAEGLSMPHSPRVYKGRLWVLNSGKGELGFVDLQRRRFEPVAFCPGFLRGLTFVGDHAVVGLSQSRHNVNFAGLPLDDALARHNAEARCGIQIVDLQSGNVLHSMRLGGATRELYDVVALPGVRNPLLTGFGKSDLPRLLNPPPETQSG